MWSDALLQAFVAILPVFAFQIWYDRPDRRRGIPVFLALMSCAALLLISCLEIELPGGMEAGFWFIPLIVGCLYGGYLAASGLTLLTILLRIPLLDGWWERAGFVLFLAVFLPVLLYLIGPFRRGSRRAKMRVAAAAALLASLILLGTLALFFVEHTWNVMDELALLGLTAAIVAEMLAAVFVIESVKEKQQLQHQLHTMSSNYRNEVQKLQQFIDLAPLGVIVTDRDGRVTQINGKGCRIVGQPEDVRLLLVGLPYPEIGPDMRKSAVGRMLRNALAGGETQSEIVHDLNQIVIHTGFSVKDLQTGAVIGAGLLAHDITELTRLKDEINRMDRLSLVGQMAASITHEIRNPMVVIRGFVQLMRERSPEQHQEYYRIIMEELDRANAIINDFLSLAQNRMIEKEVMSLHGILEDLAPLLWADANLRGQSIELDLTADMPLLELNAKEIKQLVLNLARNGMEAMGDKGHLRIATRRLPDAVQLTVTDTGVGIPQEKLERLFEPFYTTKSRGTGLGLPLCLSIAERHNGRIDVQSAPGEGTSFTVSFGLSPALQADTRTVEGTDYGRKGGDSMSKDKQVPKEAANADPGIRKQRNPGGPEPENPAFDKKLDGPNRPST